MAETQRLMVHGSHRLAEWALWTSGVIGSVVTFLFATLTSAFAHSAPPSAEGAAGLDLVLGALAVPPLIHVASIGAALGLARGRPWALILGRLVGGLLVIGVPVAGLLQFPSPFPSESWLLSLSLNHVLGVSFMPLPLVHAALGCLVLYDLRRPRPMLELPGADDAAPRHVARAGFVLTALGLWQAVVVVLGVVVPGAGNQFTQHPGAIVIVAIAVAALAAYVGLGVRAARRWAVPATPAISLALVIWGYVSTVLILPGLLRGGEIVDGPDPMALALGWGGLLIFAGLGLYVLVSVYRARRRFVTP